MVMRTWILRAMGAFVAVLVLTPSAAAQESDVTVTITAFSNLRSGQVFNCIDPIPFGCDRGDFYPIMTITDADGDMFPCPTPPAIINTDFLVMPSGWTCGARGARAPVTFSLLVNDFDGRFLAAIDGDDSVNLGPGAGVPVRFIAPAAPGGTATVTSSDATATVVFAVTTPPLIVSATPAAPGSIDPELGERTVTMLTRSDASAMVTAAVVNGAGGTITTLNPIAFASGRVTTYSWNGTDGSGQTVPDGSYLLKFDAAAGASATSTTVAVNVLRTTLPASLINVTPATEWWLESGPLFVQYAGRSATMLSLDVYQGLVCTAPNLVQNVEVRSNATGQFTANWAGLIAGGTAAPGTYAVGLSETAASGVQTMRGCQSFSVVSAPPMQLYLETDPLIALDDDAQVIRAVVLTPALLGRRSNRIQVFIASDSEVSGKVPPSMPAATCFNTHLCEVPSPAGIGTLATLRFGYRVVVDDAMVPGGGPPLTFDSGWFISHRASTATATAPTTPGVSLLAGVAQPNFGTFDLAHALDIAYRPGTGYTNGTAADWAAFMNVALRTRRQLFGLSDDPRTLATSGTVSGARALLSTAPDAVSMWIIPTPVNVAARIWTSVAGGWRCAPDTYNSGTFDAVGVLHAQTCRDNATAVSAPAYFTARTPTIAWHESHHVLFGLLDEYDGMRAPVLNWPDGPLNIFGGAADCVADALGSTAGSCTEISSQSPGMPFMSSGVFRLDPNTPFDVMWLNGPLLQGADTRRVLRRLAQCRSGLC